MQAVYEIRVDDKDVTALIAEHFVQCVHVDNRGFESDSFEFSIVDPGADWELPAQGRKLDFFCGFARPLVHRGAFEIDEVAHAGGAEEHDVITVRCKAADMRSTLKAQRSRSWHNTTLGAVLTEIAGNHGLTPRIADALSSINVVHLDQTNESDMNLVTRLAREHNAIGKMSDGHLLFVARGEGKTASGSPLKATVIQRGGTHRHDYLQASRPQYTGVSAQWRDTQNGNRNAVQAGGAGNLRNLRTVYKSQAEAQAAVDAAYKSMAKGKETISLELPDAIPDLFAEMPLELAMFRREIDGAGWTVESITTTIGERLEQTLSAERGDAK